MLVCQGKSVFGGIAIGKIFLHARKENTIQRRRTENTEKEVMRYEAATDKAVGELKHLYEKARAEVGEDNASIFATHQIMLKDEDYTGAVRKLIEQQKVNAEYAVGMTADRLALQFEAMEDEYLRARAADVRDISERLITILHGGNEERIAPGEPVILLAEDLAPSETLQMQKERILSLVTIRGTVNSHTAILARSLGIPALVSLSLEHPEEYDGCMAVVDGWEGVLYLKPDEELLERMKKKQETEQEQKRRLLELKGKEDITRDGHPVMLYANIGGLRDVERVLENDAAGIGLFRSEFLYLESDHAPTEEEQFQVYKKVIGQMSGKRVIIRTLDLGADKTVNYMKLKKEENPALGYRAIRICLKQPELFKTQLRAIFRAGIYGNAAMMYPMITSLSEIRQIRQLAEEAVQELEHQKVAYARVPQGIMIETPAAVMISDDLAKEVDFFSIGTNDLTQYSLAVDRQNSELEAFYDSHHPAILRMIQMVTDNAHRQGIWVGICGELGADMTLTESLLKMGIDEISVAPGQILPLRELIRRTCIGKEKGGS